MPWTNCCAREACGNDALGWLGRRSLPYGTEMIEAHHLEKRFGDLVAVRDVTLEAHPGEIVALLGPNGAGKTTTVRILAAILRPTGGFARVAGYDVETQPIAVRQRVGLLTEFPGLYNRMTPWDYLRFFAGLQGVPPAAERSRVEDLLRRFHLWEARSLPIGDFSKGMRQKVALARALLHDPPVLLLDEPTSAMDPMGARQVRTLIRELKEAGRTILLCTHNLVEAEELADRIAILRLGKTIAFDSPAELRRKLLGPPIMEVRLTHPLDGAVEAAGQLTEILEHGPNWFRYRAPEPERLNPLIVRLLGSLGAEMVALQEVPRSMEEVYLHLIGAGEEAGSETEALLRQKDGTGARPREAVP
ncbi:MAG: ABC transporter ATP-binding protein [Chloroflexia bacterium]